jgi:hypothetical protein
MRRGNKKESTEGFLFLFLERLHVGNIVKDMAGVGHGVCEKSSRVPVPPNDYGQIRSLNL